MRKAPRDGRSELERLVAGGIGGRPGVERCAVLEGSRVGRLCVRLLPGPGPGIEPLWAGRAVLPRPDAEAALLFAGGEYGGMGSPLETVVWYEGASETVVVLCQRQYQLRLVNAHGRLVTGSLNGNLSSNQCLAKARQLTYHMMEQQSESRLSQNPPGRSRAHQALTLPWSKARFRTWSAGFHKADGGEGEGGLATSY